MIFVLQTLYLRNTPDALHAHDSILPPVGDPMHCEWSKEIVTGLPARDDIHTTKLKRLVHKRCPEAHLPGFVATTAQKAGRRSRTSMKLDERKI